MNNGHSTLYSVLPVSPIQADMGLATIMMTAPLWVGAVNQWLALIGGVLGISIAAARLWRIFRGKE